MKKLKLIAALCVILSLLVTGCFSLPSIDTQQMYYAEGTYEVGQDMPAGEYVLSTYSPESSPAYFQVLGDNTGFYSSIVCYDEFYERSIVTVNEGEYLTAMRCLIYPIDTAQVQEQVQAAKSRNGALPSGTYKVGLDLPPGEYKVRSTSQSEEGYYEVTNNSRHDPLNIISNDSFEGEKHLTISNDQYLKLRNAELILPQ